MILFWAIYDIDVTADIVEDQHCICIRLQQDLNSWLTWPESLDLWSNSMTWCSANTVQSASLYYRHRCEARSWLWSGYHTTYSNKCSLKGFVQSYNAQAINTSNNAKHFVWTINAMIPSFNITCFCLSYRAVYQGEWTEPSAHHLKWAVLAYSTGQEYRGSKNQPLWSLARTQWEHEIFIG